MSEPPKKEPPKQPEPPVNPAERRATRRSIVVGVVLGGVIGVSMGLLIISFFRDSPAGTYSEPEAPIRVLPPRPTTSTATH